MMYCERCNIDFTEGLRYCKWCGQTLIEHQRNTSELQFCPNCSSGVQPKWTFCKVCGVRLATAPAEAANVACPQCGTMIGAGTPHCPACGCHLQSGAQGVPGGETPGTSIIAICPACNERVDPGSVYCKACGSALYEQQTPFGNSAIICSVCHSFNPLGSTTCRVCNASLIVTAGVNSSDQATTQVMPERFSSTLPDLADHLPVRQSTEPVRVPTERVGSPLPPQPTEPVAEAQPLPPTEPVAEPRHVTDERVSPMPSREFDSGAYTLTFNSQHPGGFTDGLPTAPPAPPRSNETGVLPGVAGSKSEQPSPTMALNMGRNTGPFGGEDLTPVSEEALPPSEPPLPSAPLTRLDSEALPSASLPPSVRDTFTFTSDVDATPPEGTVGLRADNLPPAEFASEAKSSPTAFVWPDEPALPKPPTAPIAPVSDTDRNIVEATQIIASAPPSTEAFADTTHRFDGAPPATAPLDHVAQAPPAPGQIPYYAQRPAPAPPSPIPAQAARPTKSRAGLIIGLIIGLFFLGIAGGGLWWYLHRNKPVQSTATVTPAPTTTETPTTTEPAKPTAPPVPEGMVPVPAGTYTIGRDHESDLEGPQHSATLPAYFIDRTEVTNEAYKKFVDETKHKPPVNWPGQDFPTGRANYPVTGITWQDAADYAQWAGKRLPTEEEWEAAARGPEGRRYPWGEEWLPGQANIDIKGSSSAKDTQYPPQIMEVGGFPQGASPVGALDLIGNVWEWTADEFKFYPGNSATLDDPKVKADLKIKPGVTYRVIRGGAFDGDRQHDNSYRGFLDASLAYPKTGFRCVKDAK